jgi:hypothetical protein
MRTFWTLAVESFNNPLTESSTTLQPSTCSMRCMSPIRHADRVLHCHCCGQRFVYSAGEQELHAVRGVAREPRVCPACRKLVGN